MEGINTMPRDEYYRRLGVAVGKVGQRLLRKGEEYNSLSRKHENLGRKEEAMDAFFMDIAYQTAHYAMIKRYEEIRARGIGQPLFTLTAEEVKLIEPFVDNRYQHYTNIACIYREDNDPREPFCRKAAEVFLNLLTRIKQWQDEKI